LLSLQIDAERLFQTLAAGAASFSHPDRGLNQLFDLDRDRRYPSFSLSQDLKRFSSPGIARVSGVADPSLSFTLDTLDLLNCIQHLGASGCDSRVGRRTL
jgi:hypothetical protein